MGELVAEYILEEWITYEEYYYTFCVKFGVLRTRDVFDTVNHILIVERKKDMIPKKERTKEIEAKAEEVRKRYYRL